MSTLQCLRNATLLARLVLAWLVLVTGVAIASPLAKPSNLVLVCSGSGVMQLLVNPGDGGEAPIGATLDCPLCASGPAPDSWRVAQTRLGCHDPKRRAAARTRTTQRLLNYRIDSANSPLDKG
jgi:hypothetical protein